MKGALFRSGREGVQPGAGGTSPPHDSVDARVRAVLATPSGIPRQKQITHVRKATLFLIPALLFVAPLGAQAQDPQTIVVQFRDTLNQAKISLIDIQNKRGAEKTNAKREVLGLLSKGWILLQRIPPSVQEAESLGEDQRFVEDNLKELGTDPRIRRIKDTTLLSGIQVLRAGNLSEALMKFEELRMMDPTDPAGSFMVRHINRRLDEESE